MFRSLNWEITLLPCTSLCIGPINDEKVGGLESLLNYMNENFPIKDGPAINEHHYHITKKQYNEEVHNIYNVDRAKDLILRIIDF